MASVLIERIMGIVQPRIPQHELRAVMYEWKRGLITGAQANAAIAACSERFAGDPAAPLDAESAAEAQQIIDLITTGTTAENKADRAIDMLEVEDVLMMIATRLPPYDTPGAARARLFG